jgi:hypothetical protein
VIVRGYTKRKGDFFHRRKPLHEIVHEKTAISVLEILIEFVGGK